MGVLACSRVIMKTALALAVAMFLVASASAHGHRNKNNNNKNNKNKNRGGKREERCGLQQYTVSEKTYKQECHEEYETKCATSYGHSYGHGHGHLYGHYTAPINECVEVPVHNKVCTKEPVESCDQVAKEVPV